MDSFATAKQVQARFPKAPVHETVGDRIAARRRIGEQLKVADGRVAKGLIHKLLIEQSNGVDDIQWCPTDEELQHHDKQHLDDALFIL